MTSGDLSALESVSANGAVSAVKKASPSDQTSAGVSDHGAGLLKARSGL